MLIVGRAWPSSESEEGERYRLQGETMVPQTALIPLGTGRDSSGTPGNGQRASGRSEYSCTGALGTNVRICMRHVKIIERLAGGPRYEDPNLAFRPRGRASRTLAGSTRQA